MAISKFDIINRALRRAGADPIDSLDDESAEGIFMAAEYEQFAEEKLGTYRWRFCQELASLGSATTPTPADRWTYAFSVPSNLLILHSITRAGSNVEYERWGEYIFTDEDADLVAEYSFRADELKWPPYFREPFVDELASIAARSLARNDSLADRLENKVVNIGWPKARHLDSQQQPNKRIRAQSLIAIRRGR